ncbi:MAG TPA: glutamate--tRNA ligase [Candidatus Dormibacteraeota bacterium]|nr:glutamate--tRNA ligase [Candidatus Dormibacteraeota bacterium]
MAERPVRVRMAPSPTGPIHVGSARTALFNVLFARRRGGKFILRIDDTDLERSTAADEEYIYDGLGWLGLHWDEGPIRQSERLDLYRQEAVRLIDEGNAYRCWCTPEELAAEREAAQREKRPYKYSRRCLTEPPQGRRTFVIRFRVPQGIRVEFTDLIRGAMSFDADLIGDPVIVKSDGFPTYNFASPIDDSLLEISHVIRGEEHLSNTPTQLMIVDALGYARPEATAHIPLILAPDRTKLSKRRHPALITQFREWGYLPEAMVNYLALLGWNPGTEQEIFSLAELEAQFDLGRVQQSGAIFDREKLDWINATYIRGLPIDELVERLKPFLPQLSQEQLERAAPALRERMKTLADAPALLAYLWTEPETPGLDDQTRERLRAALAVLQEVEWEPVAIEGVLDALRQDRGWSGKQLYNPIRLAVAGGNSPPIHDTLALLPRDVALARMERAL